MRLSLSLPTSLDCPADVVGFGLNGLDLVAEVAAFPVADTKQRATRIERFPGGQIGTAMVACARLGWRARYLGAIGTDPGGDQIAAALTREGVDITSAVRPDVDSQLSIILVDARTGSRTIVWNRDHGIDRAAATIPESLATEGRILLLDDVLTVPATRMARAARAADVPTVIDVERPRDHLDDLLREVDVLIAAESFPATWTGAMSTGEALRQLADAYRPALAVVTLGSEGSLALFEGREIRTPAFRVPVVDTTGAGDAFRGGFVSAWLRLGSDASVEDLLRYANAVAALKCRSLGAQTGLPTADEVDALLTTGRVPRSN